jgi:WD40 repeat protein
LRPDGRVVRVPENPYAIAASPDGRYAFVVAGGRRWAPYLTTLINHFYLVDLTSGRVVKRGPAGVANAVYADYSPDCRHVAVAGRSGQVVVIDVDSGKPVRPAVEAYSGDSWSVWYDDGSQVTTASTDGEIALLDGRTGELLASAALPATEGYAVSNFAPDGTIVVATFNGNIFRWDPSSTHALDFACSITGRGLSSEEWTEVFPGRGWRQTCPA